MKELAWTEAMPRLLTERLLLRPFAPADGPLLEKLLGDRTVVDTTLTVPHPYPVGGGAEWIARHAAAWELGESLSLAICPREMPDILIGGMGLRISALHRHGEIGYWIAADHWGNGYATEAGRVFIDYAFSELGLHRIMGQHFSRNPASGRVMSNLGMKLEGIHRDGFVRWGKFEDSVVYAVLAPEWNQGIK